MAGYQSSHTGTQIDNAISGIIANPPLSQAAAASTYLTQSTAASTYLTENNANNIYIRQDSLFFLTNVTILINNWVSDNTYPAYPYKATITSSLITQNTYCEVIFNTNDAISGYFSPTCESSDGQLYIYATNKPLSIIVIPAIKCIKLQ